jgi:hypothetical protein
MFGEKFKPTESLLLGMQPGDTITPQQGLPPAPVQTQQPDLPEPPAPAPVPEAPTVPEPQTNWQAEPTFQEEVPQQGDIQPVSWTASEFVSHQKNSGWYLLLGIAGIVGAAIVYLLTRDVISTVTIVIVIIILGIFATRKPRTLQYQLTSQGMQIGEKSYPYNLFKSFSVIEEGAISSVMLMPLKRFMPPISVYYDPKDEQKIADLLTSYLPYEERNKDMVDRFMNKIRF